MSPTMRGLLLAAMAVSTSSAYVLRGNSTTLKAGHDMTFTEYYETVKAGRGIWKWNNALVAYDRHMMQFKGKKAIGAEVGVQSGGSLIMWKKVLGDATIHGLDINPDSVKFVDASTSITIGDQENPAMWASFFKTVTPTLDFLVDDGGHLAGQMLQTTYAVWPKLNPGGVISIEDILGDQYGNSFFEPLAVYLGQQAASVQGVHIYPYVTVVHKMGSPAYDPTLLPGAVIASTISDLSQIDAAYQAAPMGSFVVLENAAWGNFINANGLAHFFRHFIALYQPVAMTADPVGCDSQDTSVCSSLTQNCPLQAKVSAVHILPNKLIIEIPATVPAIAAVRHGTEWVAPVHDIPARLAEHNGNKPAGHHLQTK